MKLHIFTEGDSVLLLGEGNFSFARSLLDYKLPLKLIATCFDTEVKYKGQQENIKYLKENNIPVFFDVDATNLHKNSKLKDQIFTKIIFNFPHVGGKMKIQRNREFIKKICESSSHLLNDGGLLIISLCNGQGGTPTDNPQRNWNDSWQIVEMAAHGNFCLIAVEPFVIDNFQSYTCTGYRSQDSHFNLNGALVHIFKKTFVPSRFIDDKTVKQRLSLVPLFKHSKILVPFHYSELYQKDPLQNPVSAVSFFKDAVIKYFEKLCIENRKWRFLSDENITVAVKSKTGVICKVESNEEHRLRFSSTQILNDVFEEYDYHPNEIIFFPGMFFHPCLGPNFNKIPISYQFLLVGRCISKHIVGFIKYFSSLFCKTEVQISRDTILPPYKRNVLDVNIFNYKDLANCKSVIQWCCTRLNNFDKQIIAHELIIDHNDIALEACIIYTDRLSEIFLNTNSWKEIWIANNSVMYDFKGDKPPILTQELLYPRFYKFDVTLKYDLRMDLKNNDVYEILRIIAIDIISEVELINEYDSGLGWGSKCFRITYQSLNEPLYRNKVIAIHSDVISKMLSLSLPVTVK